MNSNEDVILFFYLIRIQIRTYKNGGFTSSALKSQLQLIKQY